MWNVRFPGVSCLGGSLGRGVIAGARPSSGKERSVIICPSSIFSGAIVSGRMNQVPVSRKRSVLHESEGTILTG